MSLLHRVPVISGLGLGVGGRGLAERGGKWLYEHEYMGVGRVAAVARRGPGRVLHVV